MPLTTTPFLSTDGKSHTLADYTNKVIMIVNVASKCGLTPQYEGLEKLYREYHEQGLEIIGFPANDFLAQEPGTDAEIQQFCALTYGVTFPVMQKISVKGEEQHPLYAALIAAAPTRTTPLESTFPQKLADAGLAPERDTDILWNFEKFLIGRDGTVIGRFAPDMTPEDAILREAIEGALS